MLVHSGSFQCSACKGPIKERCVCQACYQEAVDRLLKEMKERKRLEQEVEDLAARIYDMCPEVGF